jgi:general secretion pathway protein A
MIVCLEFVMYQEFFSLKEQPFSISPDPDFLFLSAHHKEALAHLKYGLQSHGGFVLLTGEVGTGKTTVCRSLLQDTAQELDIAFILNPALTEIELLATICDEFKIEYQQDKISLKLLFDTLASWIMSNHLQGRRAVVLIDEAQHLSFSVLEQLRLLTNIESSNKKSLQVILIGQTELQEKLKQTKLRQLSQRITARYHLLPLTKKETQYYIEHRLSVAGAAQGIFPATVMRKIYKYSQGVPRLINLICERCLLCAYSENRPEISSKMIKSIIKEMDVVDLIMGYSLPFRLWWRFSFLFLLILLTGMQLPKIVNVPLLTILGEKALAVTVSSIPENIKNEDPILADKVSKEEFVLPESINNKDARLSEKTNKEEALLDDP